MNRSFRARPVRLTTAIVSAVSLTVGLSACSAGTPQVAVPPNVKSALVAAATLPPDLAIAQGLVQRACLSTKGFVVPFDSSVPSTARPSLIGVEGLFASEENARAIGYSSTVTGQRSVIDQFESSLPTAKQKEYALAYFGDDKHFDSLALGDGTVVTRNSQGCIAESDITVYGSVHNSLVVENFVNELNAQARTFLGDATTTLQDSMGTYEKCMATAGFSVTSLGAGKLAGSKFGKYRAFGSLPNKLEQSMAVTDFKCQAAAGFSAKLNTLFVGKASTWIVENQSHILGIQELVTASLARARAVVSGRQ